jgi:sulfide dehydrogenase cytochrome subunit
MKRRAGAPRGLLLRAARRSALAIVLLLPFAALAQNSNYAAELAASCTNCHAATTTEAGGIPVIAGRDKQALLKLLTDFKSGARPATVMHQLARGFNNEQLEMLAAYFSASRPGSPAKQD